MMSKSVEQVRSSYSLHVPRLSVSALGVPCFRKLNRGIFSSSPVCISNKLSENRYTIPKMKHRRFALSLWALVLSGALYRLFLPPPGPAGSSRKPVDVAAQLDVRDLPRAWVHQRIHAHAGHISCRRRNAGASAGASFSPDPGRHRGLVRGDVDSSPDRWGSIASSSGGTRRRSRGCAR